jgi:hypothetical protein
MSELNSLSSKLEISKTTMLLAMLLVMLESLQ